MAKRLEVYKCLVCGQIAEVYVGSDAQLFCCGEPMKQMPGNTTDAATEKHVPVIEQVECGFKVTVGEVPHPMVEKHYIQWIELIADGKAYTQFLNPGDAPEAVFMVEAQSVCVREHCNLHGLWKAEA